MGIFKVIKKRWNWLRHVSFDENTGFYKYSRYQKNIFIRHPRHFLPEKENSWLCESIFFKHFRPQNGDVVIDLGAGYGEEAVWLSQQAPQVQYFGIETQPVIYECLSNTYYGLGPHFRAIPFALTSGKEFKVRSQFSYASSSEQSEGYIFIPNMTWQEFCKKNNMSHISLLKMNIEGAEIDFLKSVHNFSDIARLIISCHDFRANCGEGEHFRTKNEVCSILTKNGYQIKTFSYGIDWSDDWIYAERI